MRVLLLNQFYHPDIAATAQLCADLAEDLAALGHEVTVIAGTARYRVPHRGAQAESVAPLPLTDEHRGVKILRVPVVTLPGPGLMGRITSYGSFFVGALARALTAPRPDVVVALSTPPMLGALGVLTQALRGAGFVYWVQDVYPELLVAFGVLSSESLVGRGLVAGLAALARGLYHRADAVIALDEAMRDRLIAAGADPGRVHVIDHFGDARAITPLPAGDNPLRRQLGLGPEAFLVCYAGNHGRGHDFATLLDALRLQAADPAPDAQAPLHWLFVGDGEQKAAFAQAARQILPGRVHFLPPQARAALREVLTAGDAGLVTLRAGLHGLLAPSKLYGLLAAGCPVVYVGPQRGRVPELIAAEPIGLAVETGDAAGLLAGLRALRDDPARRTLYQRTARRLAEEVYDRPHATARHAALLQSIAQHLPAANSRRRPAQ